MISLAFAVLLQVAPVQGPEQTTQTERTVVATMWLQVLSVAVLTGTLLTMMKQQESTEQTLATMKSTSVGQLRPYLAIVSVPNTEGGPYSLDHLPCLRFHVKNCGATPAVDVRSSIHFCVYHTLSEPEIGDRLVVPTSGSDLSRTVLHPGQSSTIELELMALLPEVRLAWFSGGARVFVEAAVEYRDEFCRDPRHPHRRTDFRVEFKLTRTLLEAHAAPWGNDAT
ncbi:MAG TPA: hypothetical protein PL091_15610 [Actinomycetota bacterium]|nr:hypothetical protein [Actinomycetota bacterium]HRX18497.1 hypothetical protein [Gemmatimonadales bacterium]